MTLEIALAVTLLVFLATLAGITFFTLRRLLTMVFAHLDARKVPDSAHRDPPDPSYPGPDFPLWTGRSGPHQRYGHHEFDATMSAEAVFDGWAYGSSEERIEDEDSGPTLLPLSTLPPFPYTQTVEYSEEEDDVPTTLYRTDDDEIAPLAEFDD
jgi:hypothetical protein